MSKKIINKYILINSDKIKIRKFKLLNDTSLSFKDRLNLKKDIYRINNESIGLADSINRTQVAEKHGYYAIAEMITSYALKVLERGKKYTDKNGVVKFTYINPIALKILKDIENPSCGREDLIQCTVLQLLEQIAAHKIFIGCRVRKNSGGDKIEYFLHGDKMAIRSIFNAVQNELQRQAIKHAKKLQIPAYTEDGKIINQTYTADVRAYNLSLDNLEFSDIINRLKVNLSDVEKDILSLLLIGKQKVDYTYHSKNSTVKYKFAQLTTSELANKLNLSSEIINRYLALIRAKVALYLQENAQDLSFNDSYVQNLVDKSMDTIQRRRIKFKIASHKKAIQPTKNTTQKSYFTFMNFAKYSNNIAENDRIKIQLLKAKNTDYILRRNSDIFKKSDYRYNL